MQPDILWHSENLKEKWVNIGSNSSAMLDTLIANDALSFPVYKSGMTPASSLPTEFGRQTGMGYAWIRDNCHVANALLEYGDIEKALGIAKAILLIFKNSERQLDDIISGTASHDDVMNRPPVRVEGDTLAGIGKWPNAQNDSIGYTLWIVAKLVRYGMLSITTEDRRILGKIVEYLAAISYWQDEDSGHWEEDRKINASSIGAVLSGLREIKQIDLLPDFDQTLLAELIEKGRSTLDALLAVEPPHDASLIFLVEPLRIVDAKQAAKIVRMVEQNLLREYGIIRYPEDSYWGVDYREHFTLGDRTADFSGRLDERARYNLPNHEAQWTLFDPLLAVYYAKLGDSGSARYYLERSLAAFVGRDDGWRIPEAYFFEHGTWVENDHVPLLWSQANVLLALTTN